MNQQRFSNEQVKANIISEHEHNKRQYEMLDDKQRNLFNKYVNLPDGNEKTKIGSEIEKIEIDKKKYIEIINKIVAEYNNISSQEQEQTGQFVSHIPREKIENFLENVYDPEDESAPSGVAQLSDYEAWVLVQALKKIDDLAIRIYDAVEQLEDMDFMKAQQIY